MPVWIAGLIGAVVLVWLVARVSVGNSLLESRPDLAAGAAAWHPGAVLEPLGEALEAGEEINPEMQAAAMAALKRAPLSEEPLLLEARNAIAAGDLDRADRLIRKAHRRNPRSRYALVLLLERQLRNNEIDDAARTMAVLGAVMPNSGGLLLAQMARMAQYPEAEEAIAGVIRAHPALGNQMLEQLARQGAEPDLILRLAGPAVAERDARWQELMLESLVDRGQVARARDLWTRFAGVEAPETVYDPDFRGLPGSTPFNWRFETSSDAVAEIAGGSPGLYVVYYARQDAQLGEQLIMLPPGRYQLSFKAEGDAPGEDGQIAWTISCHPRGNVIGRVPIVGVGAAAKTIAGDFTVPAGCAAQWLRLTGDFAEFPENQQATIRELRVTTAGQS